MRDIPPDHQPKIEHVNVEPPLPTNIDASAILQPVRHGMLALGFIACILTFGLARRISTFPLTTTTDLLLFGNAGASLVLGGVSASTYVATFQHLRKSALQYSIFALNLCLTVLSCYVLYSASQQSTTACYISLGVTLPVVGFLSYALIKLQGHIDKLINRNGSKITN
jgi:hypothetical protein